MAQVLIKNVVRQLRKIQEGYLWFDQCFKDKIDELSAAEALTSAIPRVRSATRYCSHMLAWRKACMIRFKGLRTDLMNSPDDWKDNAALSKIGRTELKNAVYNSQYELNHLVESQDDTYLNLFFFGYRL